MLVLEDGRTSAELSEQEKNARSHRGEAARAMASLRAELPGLNLAIYAADEWGCDPAALERCREDIAQGDIILATMLFLDEHIQAVLPALTARRDQCDAMIGCLSAGEVCRLTRIGKLTMSGSSGGIMSMLKRLRGGGKSGGSSGQGQMKMLRQIPRLLRFIPGKAQDLRAYFLTLQYWLCGTDENIANLIQEPRVIGQAMFSDEWKRLGRGLSPEAKAEIEDMRSIMQEERAARGKGGKASKKSPAAKK